MIPHVSHNIRNIVNRRTFLLFIIICAILLPVHAQRDYHLIETRNPWLMSDNAAALTTFSDSAISKADIYAKYTSGPYRTISEGKEEWTVGADVSSYYRLTPSIVAYGNASYKNFSGTDMDGSMFMNSSLWGRTGVNAFDILDDSITNTGRKHYELYNITGAIGWNLWRTFSLGAKADFTAGNYAKYKDLRHRNTLMNLNTNIGFLLDLPLQHPTPTPQHPTPNTQHPTPITQHPTPITQHPTPTPQHPTPNTQHLTLGASFLYRRSTETMLFEEHGTTDHIYKSFIEYANGIGEVETFGGEGFTDHSIEQPLFDEYCGFSIQGSLANTKNIDGHPSNNNDSGNSIRTSTNDNERSIPPLDGDHGRCLWGAFSYLHRHGYYGKESQYTASHENHSGNILDYQLRYTFPSRSSWIALHINDQQLTAYRTNYREEKTSDNVTTYQYYAPTKISDKILRQGDLSYTGYFIPIQARNTDSLSVSSLHSRARTDIFLWHINAGISWRYSRQTAYLNLDSYNSRCTIYIPHVLVARNILFQDTSMITAEAGFSAQCGEGDKVTDLRLRMAYELPLRTYTTLRPNISLSYDWQCCNSAAVPSSPTDSRHNIVFSIGAIF